MAKGKGHGLEIVLSDWPLVVVIGVWMEEARGMTLQTCHPYRALAGGIEIDIQGAISKQELGIYSVMCLFIIVYIINGS